MPKLAHLHAKTLTQRKVWAAIFFALVVLAIPVLAAVDQQLASTNANNGNLTGTYSITSQVSQVWGFGNTSTLSAVWEQATLTLSPSTNSVTATFPAGFKVNYAILATANSSFDVYHILEHSYIYSYSTITTTTGTKLMDAYSYIATFHNSSATGARSDKGIVAPSVNATLYSSQTNNLGQEVAYPILSLFASNYNAKPMYAFVLDTTNTTSTYQASFTLKNYLQEPFAYNLFIDGVGILTVTALLDIALLYNVVPRHSGGSY